MSFLDVQHEYMRLRRSLASFVHPRAMEEVSLQIPTGDDEASFLRLVAWSYGVLFEAGRVAIPYLMRLASSSGVATEQELADAHQRAHDLRTWSFHNLNLSSGSDLRVLNRTGKWMLGVAGKNPPIDSMEWHKCFVSLCADVEFVLSVCARTLELALAEEQNEPDVLSDLRGGIERNWPAAKFDEVISDAASRLAVKVNVVSFREPRLARWRQFLESVSEDDDPASSLVRLIERDLHEHLSGLLPFDGSDLMRTLGLAPGPEVGRAFALARSVQNEGITDRDELLSSVKRLWLGPGANS